MLLYEGHGHATRGGNGFKHSDRKRLTDPVKLYFKNGVKIKLLAVKEKLRNFVNRLNSIGIKEVFREGRKCGKGLGTRVRKELALQAESHRTRVKEQSVVAYAFCPSTGAADRFAPGCAVHHFGEV